MPNCNLHLKIFLMVFAVNAAGYGFASEGDPSCEDRGDYPFGWNPITQTSCRLDLTSACIDSDGDGWGWDGHGSCIYDANKVHRHTSQQTACTNNSAISDPDGDGYGWENNQTCIVMSKPGACIDTQPLGDGWGWDGTASCRVDSSGPNVQYTIALPNGHTVQSVPGPISSAELIKDTEWACDDNYWYPGLEIWYYPSSNSRTYWKFNHDGTGSVGYYRMTGDGAITWEWSDYGVLITSGHYGPAYGGLNLFTVNSHPEISYWIEEDELYNGESRTVYRAVETGTGYYSGGRVCWQE